MSTKNAVLFLLTLSIFTGTGCVNNAATTKQSNTTADSVSDAVAEEDIIADEDVIDPSTEELQFVEKDVFGEDLSFVERYPDSIRSYFSKSELETAITYETTADQEQVRKHFSDQLTTNGWENSEQATDYMEFMKGDENNPEYLTLYLTPYNNGLEYELVYEPAYTEEQLQEIEQEEELEIIAE
jgi:hypothetical protein